MLGRNTLVSCAVFLISIVLLWVLVEFFGMNALLAAAIGFVVANTVHFAFGHAWIFAGTDRPLASGYMYFLATSGVGLAITMTLYAVLLRFTPMDYVVARVLVSLVAGLIMFALNAVLNFRRL